MKQMHSTQRRGWRWWAWHVVGRHGGAEACRRHYELDSSQWTKPDALIAAASQRLQQQLELASGTVPYYRQQGCGPRLADFPVLRRLTLQQQFAQLASPLAQQRRAWTLTSSGSSGVVIRVRRDAQTQAWATACTWRGDCWGTALRPEDRQLSLLSNVGNIQGSRRALSPAGSWLHNRFVLSAMSITAANARELVARIDALRPQILSGYPSILYLLARFGLELGLRPPRLSKVLPTAESCSSDEAAVMEQFFRVPVRQRYGSHEFSAMAHQCEQGTWHWHAEVLLPEVLLEDGSISNQGRGSLLCTSLVNQSMPLIRYEIGDIVDLNAVACSCGRGLPGFSALEGRASEFVYCPDGRWISSHAFLAPLRSLPLLQFQLLQEQEGSIKLCYVATSRLDEEQRGAIQSMFDQIHGGQLKVEIEQVDELQRTAGGKLLRTVNRLPRPAIRF